VHKLILLSLDLIWGIFLGLVNFRFFDMWGFRIMGLEGGNEDT